MSASDNSGVRQYVVRSKTPSNSEKVLLYLRGMERAPPSSVPSVAEEEEFDHDQLADSDDIPAHHPLSPRSKTTEPERRESIPYTDAGRPPPGHASQVGRQSQVPAQAYNHAELRMPDPKHVSHQTDQSWGNTGPLPSGFSAGDLGMAWSGGSRVFPQTTGHFAGTAAGFAPQGPSAAASPQPIQINLTIHPPTEPRQSKALSQVSGQPYIMDIPDEQFAAPHASTPRAPSQMGSAHPSRMPLPLSPRSAAQPVGEDGWDNDWEDVQHPERAPARASSQARGWEYDSTFDQPGRAASRSPGSMAPSARVPAPARSSISNAPGGIPFGSTALGARVGGSIAPSATPRSVAPDGRRAAPRSVAPSGVPAIAPGPQIGGSRVTQLHPLTNRVSSEAPVAVPRSRAASQTSNAGYQPLIFSTGTPAPPVPIHEGHYHPGDELDEEEEEMVNELLTRTPRTSYTTPSVLAAEIQHSSHHDEDLCILLHAADDSHTHEVVKRAVRKAIRTRLKKLGMKGDNDAIKAYRDVHDWEYHSTNTGPGPHSDGKESTAAPPWAQELLSALHESQARLAEVEKRLEHQRHESDDVQSNVTARPEGTIDGRHGSRSDGSEMPQDFQGSPLVRGETELDATERMTHIESVHHPDGSHYEPEGDYDTMRRLGGHTPPTQDGGVRHALRDFMKSDQGSLGDQVYEQELWKLRMKPVRTGATHQTWDMTRADPGELMPEISDSEAGHFQGRDTMYNSAEVPVVPAKENDGPHAPTPAPWQKIHQSLLDWAMAWSMSELDKALNSTTRGNQVDGLAITVWTTQTYKRYVRLKLTENPPSAVDKMFVPPLVADAVSNAVFSGRHSEASDQLRKLWNEFELKGSPRQIIVLAQNKRQENHWVVHRFDLVECTLNTYDTSIEKSPPDSRPLGWWFAIKAAFPAVPAPQSGHLYQNHVRMPRPLQYIIDNSVAAAAIWRNLLMSAKAERAIDLERLRDLINTEVKNLRQRKEMGKLTATVMPLSWEQING
ncbi:hypothetical protein BKA62DRAFT_681217 [Auriculariales sp. MPI-PUGE-AT-0066]|nr:hypothetical protein BKA62DRAFT_681217 [Auriculariales sp. MPI-PUGE-AT-0066]